MSWATKEGYSEVVALLVRRDRADPEFEKKMAQAMFLWSVSGENLSRSFKVLYTWNKYKWQRRDSDVDYAPALQKGSLGLIKFLLEHFEVVKFQSRVTYSETAIPKTKGSQQFLIVMQERDCSRPQRPL